MLSAGLGIYNLKCNVPFEIKSVNNLPDLTVTVTESKVVEYIVRDL